MKIFEIILLIGAIFLSTTCQKNIQGSEVDEYFEGYVTFSIVNEALHPRYKEFVTEYLPKKMVGIVKEDKYKMVNPSKNLGSFTTIIDLKELKIYEEFEYLDTIKWYPLDESPGDLISVSRNQKEQKELLGGQRESVTIIYSPNDQYIDRAEGTFYFHPDYKLNKDLYANHKYNFWNHFVNESGSISIRNEQYFYPVFKTVYEATEIQRTDVPEEEFRLDPAKVIVKGVR